MTPVPECALGKMGNAYLDALRVHEHKKCSCFRVDEVAGPDHFWLADLAFLDDEGPPIERPIRPAPKGTSA